MLVIAHYIGQTVLVKLATGECNAQPLHETNEKEARLDHKAKVEGYGTFDGEHRSFYRVPGAKWTFCLKVWA